MSIIFQKRYVKKGFGAWPKLSDFTSSDRILFNKAFLEQKKQEGYDHIRLVNGPHLWQEGKEGIYDLTPLMLQTDLAIKCGLRVIWASTPWAIKLTQMFTENNVALFDIWFEHFAKALQQTDPKRVAWEFLSEPGWYNRDTSKIPNIGGNENQRPVGTEFYHRFCDHAVPFIRSIAPNHTLYMGLPGWGHTYGSNEHLLIGTNRFTNTIQYCHFYWPFMITHDKDNIYTWPDPDWKSKTTGDINTIDYINDRKTIDIQGLNFQLDKLASWRDSGGFHLHVTECGLVFHRESKVQYMKDLEEGFKLRNIPFTWWIG